MININFNNQDIIREDKKILSAVNLAVETGDFILFSGPSGSGKTTLINEIIENYDGTVGRVFQDASQQFAMETPFMELVFLFENLQVDPAQIENRVIETLEEFKLEDKSDQNVMTLSGGEQQRLSLAEALAVDSELLILDEPFASVDSKNEDFLMTKISGLKNKTVIVADHNPFVYKNLVNKIYLFDDGQIESLPKIQFKTFFSEPKKHKITSVTDGLSKLTLTDFHIECLIEPSSLSIPLNSKTLLVGENGVGKSSFLNSIVGLRNYEGKIENGHEKTVLAFQQSTDTLLKITVEEEINFAKRHVFRMQDIDIDSWLKRFSLADHLDQSIYTLSGGERKKLQVLSLQIQNPELLLLDEPFAGLDSESIKQVLELLNNPNQTQIIISHQFNLLENHINNLIGISDLSLHSIREATL